MTGLSCVGYEAAAGRETTTAVPSLPVRRRDLLRQGSADASPRLKLLVSAWDIMIVCHARPDRVAQGLRGLLATFEGGIRALARAQGALPAGKWGNSCVLGAGRSGMLLPASEPGLPPKGAAWEQPLLTRHRADFGAR